MYNVLEKTLIRGVKMTVSFSTLGCKVNQYESEALAEIFEAKGFTVLPSGEAADIIIVNSCTVTAESNRKVRQTVRKLRRKAPEALIVLTGCMAQAFPEECKEIKEANLIIGNSHYDKLPDICINTLNQKTDCICVVPHEKGYTDIGVSKLTEHTRGYIKIEDGCNRFCSYCIIPYARGRVRSRSLESIKKEAEALATAGYKEAVLVGINLSAFGLDTGNELCDAVEVVSSVDGIKRVRLGSLECDQISDNALEKLAANEKFCPQFHLSLQSGCDKTLKEMNRKYDTAFYKDLVARIRAKFQNPTITTDIMVGFMGESDEDFKKSCDFIKEIGFARSHVFVYSVREGTAAAKRTDKVSPEIQQQRAKVMQKICENTEKEFLQSQIGTLAKVLLENVTDGIWEGYSENYTRIKIPNLTAAEGDIVTVRITAAENDYCIGEIEVN